MPTLDSLQAQLGGEHFEVVALSVDHAGISVVEKFYRKTGIQHLRQYIDPSTMATSTLGIEGVPTTLLIDHDGREIGRLVGAAEWDSPAMVDLMTRTIDEAWNLPRVTPTESLSLPRCGNDQNKDFIEPMAWLRSDKARHGCLPWRVGRQ